MGNAVKLLPIRHSALKIVAREACWPLKFGNKASIKKVKFFDQQSDTSKL